MKRVDSLKVGDRQKKEAILGENSAHCCKLPSSFAPCSKIGQPGAAGIMPKRARQKVMNALLEAEEASKPEEEQLLRQQQLQHQHHQQTQGQAMLADGASAPSPQDGDKIMGAILEEAHTLMQWGAGARSSYSPSITKRPHIACEPALRGLSSLVGLS